MDILYEFDQTYSYLSSIHSYTIEKTLGLVFNQSKYNQNQNRNKGLPRRAVPATTAQINDMVHEVTPITSSIDIERKKRIA